MHGTLPQLPILTMPSDDIRYPISDLTGGITEGQAALSRDNDRRALYPPADVLRPALERDVAEIETQLEELEPQDAIAMRHRA